MVSSTQEAELEDQELEASLGCIVRPNFKTQKQTNKKKRKAYSNHRHNH